MVYKQNDVFPPGSSLYTKKKVYMIGISNVTTILPSRFLVQRGSIIQSNSLGRGALAIDSSNVEASPVTGHDIPIANLRLDEQGRIQTGLLGLLGDAQTHPPGQELEGREQDEGEDEAVGGNGGDLGELLADLDTVPVDTARLIGHAVEHGFRGRGEDARHEGSDHAANSVEFEDIEPFVDAYPPVDVPAQRADDRGDEPDQHGQPHGHETGSRRDAHQTRDGTLARAHGRKLAAIPDKVNQAPTNNARAGSSIGVEDGEHGSDAGVEGRASVEAKPPGPDQRGAEKDQGGVMRLLVEGLLAGLLALSQHQGVRQSAPTRGNVDRSAAGKVE